MSISVLLVMGLALAGASLAVTSRNILHAILGLAIALMGIAGVFLYLNSPFLAAMEVLIYVGGISVAMVFALMVSASVSANRETEPTWKRIIGVIPAGAFLALMVYIFRGMEPGEPPVVAEEAWSVEAIGYALLTHYNLVFELLSLVLLLAIMGSIAIARRVPGEEGGG